MYKFLITFLKVLSVAPLAFLVGCATIVNGRHQTVSVTTPPTTGASCMLTNNKGTWYVDKTPASVVVHRSYEDLTVTCHKHAFEPSTKAIKSNTKKMAFGNAVFGGVIGAGVDVSDGAAYSYPNKIVIPMKPINASSQTDNNTDNNKAVSQDQATALLANTDDTAADSGDSTADSTDKKEDK
ncbi:MAG: hypothetical protein AAGA27_04660 [Pseudomonadota bacterium]